MLLPLLAASVTGQPLEARKAAAINAGTLALIEQEEGFRANFYNDQQGEKTIGYGHDCVQLQDCGSIHAPITKAQGVALLKKDLKSYESCVCGLPNAASLNANEYGALVSFTYNSGCQGAADAWQSLMQQKNFKGICKALPTTNTKGGIVSGRRQQEANLCNKATSAKSGC
ncbi:MAG: hypothetical protein MMC23_001966 [Stictis urceolatum]|nr:hypothetical protein [Stictis urceolata]